MTTIATRLAVVLLVSLVGIALKVVRYGSGEAQAQDLAAGRVSDIMAQHGWLRVVTPAPQPLPFEKLTFARAGCPVPVSVAVLPGNAESADFARLHFRGDVAFVQEGEVAPPSGRLRQLGVLRRLLPGAAGAHALPMLPPLALSPAPRDGEACTPPSAGAWAVRSMGR